MVIFLACHFFNKLGERYMLFFFFFTRDYFILCVCDIFTVFSTRAEFI